MTEPNELTRELLDKPINEYDCLEHIILELFNKIGIHDLTEGSDSGRG